ncbi:hypothetical protein IWZ00DRAFT_489720 [Phyllosticta capitalensis]|uniref:Uncharacterized protein n=1 Tax=Phyllosticta capitalensis TaxID=121624 RepID=A0ABR1YKP7_9PEZI
MRSLTAFLLGGAFLMPAAATFLEDVVPTTTAEEASAATTAPPDAVAAAPAANLDLGAGRATACTQQTDGVQCSSLTFSMVKEPATAFLTNKPRALDHVILLAGPIWSGPRSPANRTDSEVATHRLRQAPTSTDTSSTAAADASALSSTWAASSSTLPAGAPAVSSTSTLLSSSSIALDDAAAAGPAAVSSSTSSTLTSSTLTSSTLTSSTLTSTTTTAAAAAADTLTSAPTTTATTGPTASVSSTTEWVEVYLSNGSPTWTPTVVKVTFAAVADQLPSAGSGTIGLGEWSTANLGAQPTAAWYYVGAGLGAGVGVLGALL